MAPKPPPKGTPALNAHANLEYVPERQQLAIKRIAAKTRRTIRNLAERLIQVPEVH